jgi:nesprin-1
MGKVMSVFRDFKEETERLLDWLKQADINLKAAKTSMLATLEEKERAVKDVKELHKRLKKGSEDVEKYSALAAQMKDTCLQANVETQKEEVVARYEAVCKSATEVSQRVTNHYDQHYEFEVNYNAARDWMDLAWGTVRACSTTEGKNKDDLHGQLDKIRDLIGRQEEGQRYVNEAVDWGEKAVRNTRSDGRDKINQAVKDLQADWEKLVRKMSGAKVSVETDLLKWTDAQQSVSRLQEWINDKESRLQQALQSKHVMITRRSTLGISTLSSRERTATLRQTNSILQDIQAFEPMIQSVAASSTATATREPVDDIQAKYADLSRQAQELYDREKEMVDRHEAFIATGHEFMAWLRAAKERLARCSEPTGDRDALAEKAALLRVLESEVPEGEAKLETALKTAADACAVALADDKAIVEEEVAFLQVINYSLVRVYYFILFQLMGFTIFRMSTTLTTSKWPR